MLVFTIYIIQKVVMLNFSNCVANRTCFFGTSSIRYYWHLLYFVHRIDFSCQILHPAYLWFYENIVVQVYVTCDVKRQTVQPLYRSIKLRMLHLHCCRGQPGNKFNKTTRVANSWKHWTWFKTTGTFQNWLLTGSKILSHRSWNYLPYSC